MEKTPENDLKKMTRKRPAILQRNTNILAPSCEGMRFPYAINFTHSKKIIKPAPKTDKKYGKCRILSHKIVI